MQSGSAGRSLQVCGAQVIVWAELKSLCEDFEEETDMAQNWVAVHMTKGSCYFLNGLFPAPMH